MAQPSIANYFSTRKRTATEETKLDRARKVLILDQDESKSVVRSLTDACLDSTHKKYVNNNNSEMLVKISSVFETHKSSTPRKKATATPRSKKAKAVTKHGNIEQLFSNMSKNTLPEVVAPPHCTLNELKQKPAQSTLNELKQTPPQSTLNELKQKPPQSTLNELKQKPLQSTLNELKQKPPQSTLNELKQKPPHSTLNELKQKMCRSSRLAELKASIARFKQSEEQLKAAEKKTTETKETITLKNFKAIELEVNLSPQKPQSPHKAYLSPKKDTSVCRNLFSVSSPTKNAVPMPASPSKKQLFSPIRESLTLPFKYRCVAEMFRAIDTVCQIMFNRKEIITFKKLKPAVEQMLKRNLGEKHLAQISFLYPEAFLLRQEKLREFGTGTRREQWELVITPQIGQPTMTSECLLNRRRALFKILIEKVKDYHQEFLGTLNPPMEISRDNITRWHPQFDIEKVPDVELANLPRPPNEEKFTTGSQVLEKARSLFNCNTRMERALEKLKQSQETVEVAKVENSVLKGIPKALLEKVRQRQAAKALESMTRSTAKEKEAQMYARLPEIARLTRNLFVSEKKNVLPFDMVLDKLCHSYRALSNKGQMEEYLRTISKEEGKWLWFEEVRSVVFIKLAKSYDLSLVMSKLQSLAEQKAI